MELGPSPAFKFKFRVVRYMWRTAPSSGVSEAGRPVASAAQMPRRGRVLRRQRRHCSAGKWAPSQPDFRFYLSGVHMCPLPLAGKHPQGPLLARADIAWQEGSSIEPASGSPPSPESPKTRLVTGST